MVIAYLAPYGLDKPAQVATAWLTDGTTRVYELGAKTQFADGRITANAA